MTFSPTFGCSARAFSDTTAAASATACRCYVLSSTLFCVTPPVVLLPAPFAFSVFIKLDLVLSSYIFVAVIATENADDFGQIFVSYFILFLLAKYKRRSVEVERSPIHRTRSISYTPALGFAAGLCCWGKVCLLRNIATILRDLLGWASVRHAEDSMLIQKQYSNFECLSNFC